MIRALRRLWLRGAIAWHGSNNARGHALMRDRAQARLDALDLSPAHARLERIGSLRRGGPPFGIPPAAPRPGGAAESSKVADLKRQLAAEREHGVELQRELDAILNRK